jgi:cytochrome b561
MSKFNFTHNSSAHYRLPAVALHWVIALLVIGLIALGYYMVGVPKGTPDRAFYFNLHKSLGLLAAVLILLRIGWRLRHAAPPLPAHMPAWEASAAKWTHRLLYLCLVLQPMTGYLSSSFNKYGVKFFGLALPHWGWEDKQLRELLAGTHDLVAAILTVLIVIHVLGAFKHLFVDRDQVFQRMMPLKTGLKTFLDNAR